jgi:hypothetical protein
MKFGKCIEGFTLDIKVEVKVQWNIEILLARRPYLDTWHVNKNPNQNDMNQHQT